LSQALIGLGRFDEIDATFSQLASTPQTAAEQARAVNVALNLAWYVGEESVAHEAVRRVEAVQNPGEDSASLDELAAVRATYLLSEGKTGHAIDVVLSVLARSQVSERAAVLASALGVWALSLAGRNEQALTVAAAGLERLTPEGEAFPFAVEWLRAS
jgi:hypothetical protein